MRKPIKFKASSGNSLRASFTSRLVDGEYRVVCQASWKYPACAQDLDEARMFLLDITESAGHSVTKMSEGYVNDPDVRAAIISRHLGTDRN